MDLINQRCSQAIDIFVDILQGEQCAPFLNGIFWKQISLLDRLHRCRYIAQRLLVPFLNGIFWIYLSLLYHRYLQNIADVSTCWSMLVSFLYGIFWILILLLDHRYFCEYFMESGSPHSLMVYSGYRYPCWTIYILVDISQRDYWSLSLMVYSGYTYPCCTIDIRRISQMYLHVGLCWSLSFMAYSGY